MRRHRVGVLTDHGGLEIFGILCFKRLQRHVQRRRRVLRQIASKCECKGAEEFHRTVTNAAAEESRNGLAPGVTDFPVERIKQVVQPTGDQLTALSDLSAAAVKANDIIKASCPTAAPLTPVARLDTAEARLEAVIQAVDEVRGPLEAFYDSLSDEQKQRFENMGQQAPAGGDVAALCSQHSGDATHLPIQRIEQVVQPNNQQQQDAFAALKQASRDTADTLQASCPSQVPQTPVERLDAVKTRLQAMVDAMNTIRPKLQAFYA